MIALNDFFALVAQPNLLRANGIPLDSSQRDAVQAAQTEPLFLVAGPGSGKTTALALHVLKFVFVDGIDPEAILATTFTRKAAAELRSRILGWGDKLRQELIRTQPTLQTQLEQLDLNRITTGTLDSIAEEVLRNHRAAGTQPAVVIEDFVADALMMRRGFFDAGRHRDIDLQNYVERINGSRWNMHIGTLRDITREVRDRFLHDQVNVTAFASSEHPGIPTLCDAIQDYAQALENDLTLDFAALEAHFLERLQNGTLSSFTDRIQVILVDEYQDTNRLQEQIYFTLMHLVSDRGGAITVVGDDDQSLYRFRGATVELFRDLPRNLQTQCGFTPRTIYLNRNYRSAPTIVRFYSDFLNLDLDYRPARVLGKPPLITARNPVIADYPILGLFRPDLPTLARDLTQFINQVFRGGGVSVPFQGQTFRIRVNPNGGALGDCALLCSSPREYSAGGRPRLPLLLRQELGSLTPPIQVFNPRGEEFNEVEEVGILCGLILECIDPRATVQNSISNLPTNARTIMNNWQVTAQNYITANPAPNQRGRTLTDFVNAWQRRTPQGGGNWPDSIDIMALVYNLVTWISPLQTDPEGLVYLEAISRTISQSVRFSTFDAAIRHGTPYDESSVRAALWDIFVPLATGAIDLAEELIEEFPRDRLNILSIHQSKGLEFPLTIVDVSSDFGTNHHAHAFKRFPKDGSRSHRLEDELRPYSPLGVPPRTQRDRAFDDLIRQYFVAFSRAQDVLLLIGLGDSRNGPKAVKNVATGWTRDDNWPWQGLPNVVQL